MSFNEWLDEEFEASRIYQNWHMRMFYLNLDIDSSKVSKHPYHYKDGKEFKEAFVNSSKMDNEPMCDYWKRRMISITEL